MPSAVEDVQLKLISMKYVMFELSWERGWMI
jgi:hypothetical protein